MVKMYFVRIKEEVPSKDYLREYELFTTENDKILSENIKKAIKEGKNEIEVKNAYGERDPNLITLMPLSFFKSRGISPTPGLIIELGQGIIGTIKTVSGGRVIIDLNHPLAGETVKFYVEIEKIYSDEKEFLKDLLEFLAKSNEEYEELKKNVEIDDKILLKNKKYEKLLRDLIELYGLNLEIELLENNNTENKIK